MIRLEDVVIDPEFRDLLPSLEDRSKLALKIESEGWTDEPITVWQHHNILLDGHNRLAIWQEQQERGDDVSGPPVRELKLASREAAYYWIVSNQLARRNLTDEQRRYLLGRKYTAEKGVRGGDHGHRKAAKNPNAENLHLDSRPRSDGYTRTVDRVAAESGVSYDTVQKAERYADAVDKLDKDGVVKKEDILSGKVKLPASKVVAAAKAETNEEAKAVLETKTRKKKEDAPTQNKKPKPEATDRQHEIAQSAVADFTNMVSRSKLVKLSVKNPSRDYAFDEAIKWLEYQKKNPTWQNRQSSE